MMVSQLNPMVLKLRQGAALSAADEELLTTATARPQLRSSRTSLIAEGDAPDGVMVLLEGLMCRYKIMAAGKRHIVAFLVPGDSCDVHASLFSAMDHGIETISACKITTLPRSMVKAWMAGSPALDQAIEWAALVDGAILREWLVNVGARSATQRTAHLFCELQERLSTVLLAGLTFTLPLSQEDLANALGLSVVHVNRVLGTLRQSDLLYFTRGSVRIPDLARLADFAGFTRGYLHVARSDSPPQQPRSAA